MRELETLSVKATIAGRSNHTIGRLDSEVEGEIVVFKVGDVVWEAIGEKLGSVMNRAFETKKYGPGIITEARNTCYVP